MSTDHLGTNRRITVPIALSQTNRCLITPRWFVDESEYRPLSATFELLINGEAAFRAVSRARNAPDRRRTQQRIEASQARQRDAEARADAFRKKCDALADPDAAILREAIPGLKVHVATLVAPDTPDGQPWVDVYVHSKLMLVDDTFMTLGSANLNTRSMETDSELNIAHHRHTVSQPARKKLWQMHTRGQDGTSFSGWEGLDQMGLAYKNWEDVMDKNKKLRAGNFTPIASLIEFYSGTTDRSNLD